MPRTALLRWPTGPGTLLPGARPARSGGTGGGAARSREGRRAAGGIGGAGMRRTPTPPVWASPAARAIPRKARRMARHARRDRGYLQGRFIQRPPDGPPRAPGCAALRRRSPRGRRWPAKRVGIARGRGRASGGGGRRDRRDRGGRRGGAPAAATPPADLEQAEAPQQQREEEQQRERPARPGAPGPAVRPDGQGGDAQRRQHQEQRQPGHPPPPRPSTRAAPSRSPPDSSSDATGAGLATSR